MTEQEAHGYLASYLKWDDEPKLTEVEKSRVTIEYHIA